MVHEAGHFAVAKRVGVRVLRFSIGYPPKVWGIRRGETEYVFGATPFGGYVRMLGDEVGEDPKTDELSGYLREIGFDLIEAARKRPIVTNRIDFDSELHALSVRLNSSSGAAREILGRNMTATEGVLTAEVQRCGSVEKAISLFADNPPAAIAESFKQRAFPTQPLMQRTMIVLAGPLANLVFAPILLTIVFMFGVPEILPVVGQVEKDLPAFAAGLREGDTITAINGKPIKLWADVSETIKSGDGSPIKVQIERKAKSGEQNLTLVIKPAKKEQKTIYGTEVNTWVIGIMVASDATVTKHYGPIGAMREGVKESVDMVVQICVGFAQIFSGATPVRDALGGPIMIAKVAGKEAHQGFSSLAMFIAMLSLELGLINLLPVPLLDGGHLLFFAFEGVRGKPLELRAREMMLQLGLFLLVALMAFVIYNDIAHVIQG